MCKAPLALAEVWAWGDGEQGPGGDRAGGGVEGAVSPGVEQTCPA